MRPDLPPGTPVVCTDLDRTVIYSAGALHLSGPDADAPRLLCVELHRGAPLSYLTEAAAATWRRLCDVTVLVPTTTRTPEQLARVRLPGPSPRYAIAANGGVLMVDGVPDPDWAATVRDRLAGCTPLREVVARMEQCDGEFVLKRRTAAGQFVYAVVDREALPSGWVDDLAAWCSPRGWQVSVQGRKVYAVPGPLTKSAAAREVARRCGDGPMLAAGDSLLDADLLSHADAAIRPAHGELADTGFHLDRLAVTTSVGVMAGEEVLTWLLDRAAAEVSASGRLSSTRPT
ncbi:MAG: HAD family hydrolase [Pseudonocardia sp.]|nr:HAD family hydrolase [Pseudonocardia sp.]